MSLIMDVNWNTFKQFLREDGTFFYLNNIREFVLVKPFNSYFLRAYIVKDGGMSDKVFENNELINRGAVSVVSFSFGDSKIVNNVSSEDEVKEDFDDEDDLDLPNGINREEKDDVVVDGVNVEEGGD